MGYRSNFIVVNKEKMGKLMSFSSVKEAYNYFCPDAKLDDGDDDDRYYDMQYNIAVSYTHLTLPTNREV